MRYLVLGSIGWDRPIWLDQPLNRGGRLLGFTQKSATDGIPEGRLGGGGANASTCLTNAGHDVAIWSTLRNDTLGDHIRRKLTALGIDDRFIHPTEPLPGQTVLLIEPNGERTIIFEHDQPDLDRVLRRLQKQNQAPIDLEAVHQYNPDGIFLRSIFRGYELLSTLPNCWCVAHWGGQYKSNAVVADVLIGSRDDLASIAPHRSFQTAQEICGDRLKGVIITDGARGGRIYTSNAEFQYSAFETPQVDATGAGDSFAAGVLEALTQGADLCEAAKHGAQWGAVTAGFKGCAEPRPKNTYPSWRFGFKTADA